MPDRSGKKTGFWKNASRYGLAVAIILALFASRVGLAPFLDDRFLYVTVWVAVALSAFFCGVGPSILTTVTATSAVWYWLSVSRGSRIPLDWSGLRVRLDSIDVSGAVSFLLSCAVIIALGETVRRSRARTSRAERSPSSSGHRLMFVARSTPRQNKGRVEKAETTVYSIEQARLLDLANDAILIRTTSGRISYWNKGAERLYGWSTEEAIGSMASDVLRTEFPVPLSQIINAERWEGELIQAKRDGSAITVASRWATLRDNEGKCIGWLEINTDITDRKALEEAARHLSGRILSVQDEERRRIARELHDSLGQYLVSVKMNLALVAKELNDAQQAVFLEDCLSSVEHCLSEIRTISHLLHPPLLDEAGFVSAARWYIDGFAQRSGMLIDSDFPHSMSRMNRDVETALFRVLQEALTNVHRHSAGSRVRVIFRADPALAQLQVADDGRGIPPERLRSLRGGTSAAGVGLFGMRQRMRELGGSLQIESAAYRGTTITASVPLLVSKPEQFPVPPEPQELQRDTSAA